MAQILHEHSAPARAKLFETQPLHTKYDVIRAVLARRGLNELVSYFAVPNVDTSGNQIVWSTQFPSGSDAIPLSALPPADRARILSKVQSLHDDLLRAEQQIAPTSEGRLLKSLLKTLQDVPDVRHIYSVDGKPVFVYWSHEQEQPIPEVEYPRLERIDQRARPAETVPPAANSSSGGPTRAEPAPETVVVEREVVVARGLLRFVGAVSFFGIALASVCLAGVALYYLATPDHRQMSVRTVTVVEGQKP